MPRLPRFLAAGVLLFGVVLILTGLLGQPGYSWAGLTAVAVFVPLWYLIAVVNAWLGVVSAGYPLRAELPVFGLVFGVPAAIAGVAVRLLDGRDLIVHGGRFWFVCLAGVGLWVVVALLVNLLAQVPIWGVGGPVVLVFGPLWILVCVVNLVVGMRAAGYSVLEEVPVLLLDLAVPLAVAVGAWRLARPRRAVA